MGLSDFLKAVGVIYSQKPYNQQFTKLKGRIHEVILNTLPYLNLTLNTDNVKGSVRSYAVVI